jgi:hypothetical protein
VAVQTFRRSPEWTELPVVIPRHDFAEYYFDYEPGDHVVFGGPTQISGKTQLAFDLLEYAATPDCPAYVGVSKPKDKVTTYYAKLYEWKVVREWPPPKGIKELFGKKYTGYVVWPQFGHLHEDASNASRILGEMIAERYGASARSKKPQYGIIMMDDTRDKSRILRLDAEMSTVLAMAGAMGLGEWCFVQKGSEQGETARMAYPNATHVFLFRDPTVRGAEYYGDIGGVDPYYIQWVLSKLKPRQALYIGRRGPVLAIVDADSRHGTIKDPVRR